MASVLFGGSPLTGPSTGSSASTDVAAANPTAPWAALSTATRTSDLVKGVLAGHRFIDTTTAKLDVSGADPTVNQNYKNLFALYQGVSALNGLATQAQDSNIGATEAKTLQQTFATGLGQVQSYLDSAPFAGFQVYQSQVMSTDKTTAGVAKETDSYTTGTVYSGPSTSPAPAFQGPFVFDLTVTKVSGSQTNVSFDLSKMTTPRTMGNVVAYLNSELQAAGVATRFASQRTAGKPTTITAGGVTITGAVGPDQYALKINGSSAEKLSFSAPASDPAVYVAQSSGLVATTTTTTTKNGVKTTNPTTAAGNPPDAVQQLVKFDASATPLATSSSVNQVFKQTLANTAATRALAAASDGSVYVLSDVTAATGGQAIKGSQDVALTKYDSTGAVVFTRTLGAASTASGFALALSSDGSQVAVTGSVTGDLDPAAAKASGANTSASGVDSFVTVYDSQGQELWTQQTGSPSGGDVQANAVAFGSNGMVYVAGQTTGTLPGATGSGGTDSFLQGFHATGVVLKDGSGTTDWVVNRSYVSQFGTNSTDRATGLAVSGSSVYVSSSDNGHAVVRRFDQSGTGNTALTQVGSRDLGDIQGGTVAGVAVNSDGSVVVAGSTHNGALAGGSVTQAYTGGKEVFVASLAADLQAASTDRLTYIGGGADQSATAVTVSGGQVYVAGQITTTPPPGLGQTSAHDGYVSAVDPQTGQVTWTQRYVGLDHEASPAAIAVSAGGASVLDRLGLPNGAIDYNVSQQLTAGTSLRAGDEFFVRTGGGSAQAIKITSDDTYATLAHKIQRASGFNLTATVLPSIQGAGQQLQIKPVFQNSQVEILAGPTGADALQILGLKEGVVSATASKAALPAQALKSGSGQSAKPTNSLQQGYSLQIPTDLGLGSPAAIKRSLTALSGAMSTIRSIYRDMITAPTPPSSASSDGPVPKYLTDQISNYQAALDRLTGGSGG